jgi:hypothetical protein
MEDWFEEVQSEIGHDTYARYQYRVVQDGRAAEIRFNEDDSKVWHIPLDDGLVTPDNWPATIASAVYRWWQDTNDRETVPGDCVQSPAYQGIRVIRS